MSIKKSMSIKKFTAFAAILASIFLSLFIFSFFIIKTDANATNIDPKARAHKFTCKTPEKSIPSTAPRIKLNKANIYIGSEQVSSKNQNPIIASFTNGKLNWCKNNYETTRVDGRGYGLLGVSNDSMYAVFSVDGGDSKLTTNFQAKSGWLNSYGKGGGPKAAIIARINPKNGSVLNGTFVRAQLSSGNTNTVTVTKLSYSKNILTVNALANYRPLKKNKLPMNCVGASPFKYTLALSSDLKTALNTSAIGCR